MVRNLSLLLAAGLALLAIIFRTIILLHPNISAFLSVVIFGGAVLGAAFLISWTAEAAQSYYRSTLIVVLVALIAVLPEYAVDMVFTVKAALNLEEYGSYPMANMTGANRLLIGIGWPVILFVAWIRTKKRIIILQKRHSVDFLVLLLASLYSFVIFAKKELALFDGAVLGGLFIFYFWASSRMPTEIPEPKYGPPYTLLVTAKKRGAWIFYTLFLFAALTIGLAAEPFSESLLRSGKIIGVEEFILVQWLAPLASETPEISIAILLASAMLVTYSFSILLSSKITQWTLLVAMIPFVFSPAYFFFHGSFKNLPLDTRQQEELFLTASQSIFALAVLSNLKFHWYEAVGIFVLFVSQLAFPSPEIRMLFSFIYLALAGIILASDPRRPIRLITGAWNTIKTSDNKP